MSKGNEGDQSTQVKAVIFDYGQVLCKPPSAEGLQAMAHFLSVPVTDFTPAYFALRVPYDRGDLDNHGFWLEVARKFGTGCSASQIAELTQMDYDIWTCPNPITVAWVGHFRGLGYLTGLLSNMPVDHQQYIQSRCSWLPEFDHLTFSGQVGCVKPDAKIFRHCLRGLKVQPEQALFIDDNADNVNAAEGLGIRSVLFTTTNETATHITSITGIRLSAEDGTA